MQRGPVSAFVLGACALLAAAPRAAVTVYPAPPGMTFASDRQVTVDGQSVPVYEVPVNHNRIYSINPPLESAPMAYFDFTGTVTVKVTVPGGTITQAVVRPASLGIAPQVSGNSLTFTLGRPANLTVELGGTYKRALHLFADSVEASRPQASQVTRFFGPGVHQPGEMVVGSGQSIYIAGGAVVYGSVRGNGVNGFKLSGRGILHGGRFPREGEGPKNLVYFNGNSANIAVNGVILLDAPTWHCHIRNSRDVRIDDIKIMGARANSDGIDIVSSENVFVNRAFVRGWDDNLCVKSDGGVSTRNVHFSGCVLWTDLAQSMEVGYETRSPFIRDVSFRDIDVLHAFHKPVMSIHNGAQALVENVTFENIRVDDNQMGGGDGQNILIDLWVGSSVWTANDPRGSIKGVVVKDVTLLGGKSAPSRVWGFGPANKVENVKIENLQILGKPVRAPADGNISINAHTAAVEIAWTRPLNSVRGAARRAPGRVGFDRAGVLEIAPGRRGAYVLEVADARGRVVGRFRGQVPADGVIRAGQLAPGRYALSGEVAGEAFTARVTVP